jgi:hypothetical protein
VRLEVVDAILCFSQPPYELLSLGLGGSEEAVGEGTT